ncbi:entericidin A/B family lipoprotein [Sodalis-like symbiont of Bactericera trigonica]|nr:entericidin A/B family lipoprotein [Sodalis-like symbiont of Bactericera trigonica]
MLAKMIRFLLLAALALTAWAGCNTTRGFGEDVQHLGGAISRVAS